MNERHYLLVDDNEALAENLAEILEDRGAQVDLAPSGARALELARTRRYDALLTDMRMPVMDGAQLIQAVRAVDPGLPAILLTAYSHDNALQLARQHGVLAVLPKPVSIPYLLELLQVARRDGAVALVEDDEALSDNLSEMLRSRGFTVVTAATISQTKGIGDVRPFAALVDLKVPGGALGEAARLLEARFPGLPLLVITAHGDAAPGAAHAVFQKPFESAALLAKLEALYPA